MASGRFAIATHALALLACCDDGSPSAFVACSINTHPVFLRKVMASLIKAGIATAREGRGGGYRLARPPTSIYLHEVYQALEPDGAIAPSPCEPNTKCSIGAGIRKAFDEVAQAANQGLRGALSDMTVAEFATRAQRLGRGFKKVE